MPESPSSDTRPNASAVREFDVVVVGAGFAGMYMLHRLRQLGLSAIVYEAAPDVGGTWYWNCYPGARCDAESLEYSYGFDDPLQQSWEWSERFATQPEILRYARHVADRFDLRRDIQFETRVESAIFDDAGPAWQVTTDRGDRVRARFVVMATGCLSNARVPDFNGLSSFKGPWYHTSGWPRQPVSFEGQRVGVIGTGSTGIQLIPEVAKQASQLFVFQRTANFSVPARNAPLSAEHVGKVKANYAQIRGLARQRGLGLYERGTQSALEVSADERQRRYEQLWQTGGATFMHAYKDIVTSRAANQTAVDFVHGKIREIVKDQATADALCPTDHPLGSKRICVDTNYYAVFNRDNVHLVDVRKSPIREITPNGLRTEAREYGLDAIVFATGFDAMTGSLLRIDIRGVGGQTLGSKWAEGPRNYLGLGVAGFPNLFMITGPGSPSVLSNVLMCAEQHVAWVANCLSHMQRDRLVRIEVTKEAEDAWVQHVNEVADKTLLPLANSWYVGANVPGKPRVFLPYAGGVGPYHQRIDEVEAAGYTGFVLAKA